MQCERLCQILNARLTVARIALREGVVRGAKPMKDYDGILRAKPVGAWDLVEAFAGPNETASDIVELDWRWEFREPGMLQTLLDFWWLGLGPTSSGAEIQLLHPTADRWYACWVTEEEWPTVVAAFEPLSAVTLRAFVTDLLADNGASYGVGLFGSLPSMTTNHRSDLIPADVVKEAYRAWLDRTGDAWGTGWESLRDDLIGTSEEPDHLARSLRTIQDLSRQHAAGHFTMDCRPPGGVYGSGGQLTDADRRLILDNYFAVSYRARGARGK